MGRIIFNQSSFHFDQIREGLPAETETVFVPALKFCHEWLNGKESFLLYTSGSTGLPKAVELSRAAMEQSANGTAMALGLTQEDTALVCLNTSYIAGLMMLVRGMVLDMDMLLVPPVSSPLREIPTGFWPSFAAFVPLQLQTLLREKEPNDLAILGQMKAIIVGGAAVNEELETMLEGLSSPVYSTYGMTETVSHIGLRRLNGKTKQDYYQTLPQVSIGTDERGCLKILAPVTQNEWIQTNDVVEILAPDKFRWLGRADYTINSGGIKIQPEKIEKQLERLLATNQLSHYFVAGLPHPQLGEAVTLFIETEEAVELKLLEEMRPLLDRFELPKAIISVQSFPRTGTGKIERTKITEAFKLFYSSGKH